MEEYAKLLVLIAPVFLMILAGYGLRSLKWVTAEADASLMNLLIRALFPCLILSVILGSDAVRSTASVFIPPIIGFGITALGMAVAWSVARSIGYRKGSGLRTFCFAAGIANYGFIPIPLIQDMWGMDELAVLFVHNAGVEFAIWTLGVSIVSGLSLKRSLRKAANPTAITLVVAVAMNLLGWDAFVPEAINRTIVAIAACSIPIGLIMIGMTLKDLSGEGGALFEARSSLGGVATRLLLLPVLTLTLAKILPLSLELKLVLLVQAAMPAAIMTIVVARHYGGQPMVATRVAFATTVVGVLAIPLWIRLGTWFLGV
ncbi:MAG: hypothetical protein CBD18_02915 [Opitutales bacterium TMED158]|nr:MAG: hypothetical protein CBD18_02915 [Opitutales bacterium TMED158]